MKDDNKRLIDIHLEKVGFKPKRTRRSEDQLLTDTIIALYEKIQKKITQIEDEKAVVEEVFDALRPLRELEDMYRVNK